jgi:hypothetical protein
MSTKCSILMCILTTFHLFFLVQAVVEKCTTNDKTKVGIGQEFLYTIDATDSLGKVYYIDMNDMSNHYERARTMRKAISGLK